MSGSNGNGRANGNGRGPGRPPAFVTRPSIIPTIAQCFRQGLTDKRAAEIAGIAPQTLTEWKSREGEEYDRFREATAGERSKGVQVNVKLIGEAALTDWKAAAWLLSHQHPDEFAESRRITVKDEDESAAMREALKSPRVRKALDEAGREMGALCFPGENRGVAL